MRNYDLEAEEVQEFINSAFDKVSLVAGNMEALIAAAESINDLTSLAQQAIDAAALATQKALEAANSAAAAAGSAGTASGASGSSVSASVGAATGEANAAGSASAAASSAASASASQTAAGVSAAASLTHMTTASTKAGEAGAHAANALTYQQAASQSASDAEGAASSASLSAIAATNAQVDADNAATAASGWAAAASSSASEAGTQAAASQGSATAASTSAGLAGTHASDAATSQAASSVSASNAAGSAAAAGISATTAANAAITAEDEASAATTQAANSAASASEAGVHATASLTSSTQASGFADDAEGSAVSASTSATDASTFSTTAAGSAADALVYRDAAARMTSGGVSKNPIFNTWPGATPSNTGVGISGTASYAKDTVNAKYLNALLLNTGASPVSNHPILSLNMTSHGIDGSLNPGLVLVKLELELVSGSLSGSAIRCSWTGASTVNADANTGTELTDEIGKIQHLEILVERPDTYVVGGVPNFAVQWYPTSNLTGNTRVPCEVLVHRFDYMVVTENSVASITQRASIGVTKIQTAAIGLRVKAGTAGAELELVALDDPASGPVSTARLQADNIILEGSVQAKHLTVGEKSNFILNSDFSAGLLHFTLTTGSDDNDVDIRMPGLAYASAKYPTLMMTTINATMSNFGVSYVPRDKTGLSLTGIPVQPGQWIEFSAQYCMLRTTGIMDVVWLDDAGAVLGSDNVALPPNVTGDSVNPELWPRAGGRLVVPALAAYARPRIRSVGTLSGSDSYAFWHKPYFGFTTAEATELSPYSAGGQTVIDGETIKTGTISADDITTGTLNADFLTINKIMALNENGAVAVGKTSPVDTENDGIFFGNSIDDGFGFVVGKAIGGIPQYMQFTEAAGMQIVNPRFSLTGSAASGPSSTITTSQTVVLPVGTKMIDLELLGGGGGGRAGRGTTDGSTVAATPSAGGTGGVTRVELWDGLVDTGIFWQAAGGVGASSSTTGERGYGGASSAQGSGGARGYNKQNQYGSAASGYGAGGGGGWGDYRGGYGGGASSIVGISGYDVSALAAPKLVITVGAGGAGSASVAGTTKYSGNGGAGSPGLVKYGTRDVAMIPASVLPIRPSATGVISKAASAALVFPDLGAGLWCLSSQAGDLLLDYVETHIAGHQLRFTNVGFVSFITDKTPVDVAVSATAVTYNYQFYKLGDWV